MKVSVIVPDDYLGNVIGDLNSRRGQIQGQESRPGATQIDALVPLANMFGYATDLRSSHSGPRPVLHGAPQLCGDPQAASPKRSWPSAAAIRAEPEHFIPSPLPRPRSRRWDGLSGENGVAFILKIG